MRAFFVVWCLMTVSLAHAGSVAFDFGNPLTLTTTAEQDAKLAKFLAKVNAERQAQAPPLPAITIEQYLRAAMTNTVRDQVQQGSQDEAAQFCVAYKALGANAQNQITAAGGGHSPCP